MCSCETNSANAYSEVVVKAARVEHHCFDCPTIILPGQSYVRCSGVWDRSGHSYVRCHACVELAAAMPCWTFGSLLDEAEEYLQDDTCVTPQQYGRIAALLYRRNELDGVSRQKNRRARLAELRAERMAAHERFRLQNLTSEVQ